MDFSAIVCTYNRAGNLPACLEALQDQTGVETLQWEILVVDNNSDDNTREVVQGLAETSSVPVRYTFEGEQGLNHARNRGVKKSRGGSYAFIDDDIIVRPDWLKAIYQALKEHDADAVGGRIHLDETIAVPEWIRPDMYGFLGYQDFGEESFRMDGVKRYPFGGNMAFQRRVVDKIGFFNPAVGRKGSVEKRDSLFKGAETDYFHRLARIEGARIFYQPAAIVYHRVLPFQLQKKYFRTIHYKAGFQQALYDGREYGRTLGGVPLFLYPQLARSLCRYLALAARKGPSTAFRQQMTTAHFLGQISGYRRRAADVG